METLSRAALTLAMIWTIIGSTPSTGVHAQAAPVASAYPALYRLSQGRWERSLLFTPGDQVRFWMPFRTAGRGWTTATGTLLISRARVPFYAQPDRVQQALARQPGANGYTNFSAALSMTGSSWVGHWVVQAQLRSGGASITPTFYITVRRHLPHLYRVADALALCAAHPALVQTITVGGVWSHVKSSGKDGLAGWIGARWSGRHPISHWWEHGVLWIVFPRWKDADSGVPSDGFLQVRSRLDCQAHTVTALSRAVA